MKIDDIKYFNLIFDLNQSPELRKLIKRVLRLRYKIAHRRFVRDGEGSDDDLEKLDRQHKIAMDAEILDWRKHGPEPGSEFLFMPSGLKLRLPPARRGEDIEDFLTRQISRLKTKLEQPDSQHAGTKIGIDVAISARHRDG